jgi:nucleotide-binding universal stress UspA family protein
LTGTSGSPGEFIIKVAKEEDVDMIIMGARGLGKLKKTILGSVSDHVLSKSKVPVLIFKGV